jgi:hypothetical protein
MEVAVPSGLILLKGATRLGGILSVQARMKTRQRKEQHQNARAENAQLFANLESVLLLSTVDQEFVRSCSGILVAY